MEKLECLFGNGDNVVINSFSCVVIYRRIMKI